MMPDGIEEEMAMPTRATRADWRPEEGLVVIYAGGVASEETEGIAIPLPTLHTLAVYARRYVRQPPRDPQESEDRWRTEPVIPSGFDVAVLQTSEGERVLLTLDQGLDTEISFSLAPADAHELGQRLAETVPTPHSGSATKKRH
jgi:hypothetical protein